MAAGQPYGNVFLFSRSVQLPSAELVLSRSSLAPSTGRGQARPVRGNLSVTGARYNRAGFCLLFSLFLRRAQGFVVPGGPGYAAPVSSLFLFTLCLLGGCPAWSIGGCGCERLWELLPVPARAWMFLAARTCS